MEESIDRYVLDNGLDVLHVHDLPAVASALSVARRRGIPVVYDMHENYPAAGRLLAERRGRPHPSDARAVPPIRMACGHFRGPRGHGGR